VRKLHLVGLTTDQKGLIFTARRGSDSGGYVVALDAEVLNAIAKAQGRGNGGVGQAVRPGGEFTPGPGAQTRRRGLLTPREIQSRLRAGRSVDDVAEEADVEVEWVERFAVPILAEQAQVLELARSLVYTKPRSGGSNLPLDESVAWNLLDRGARVTDDVFDVSWSAYQLHDQVWMIRFSYRSRGRAQEARWELDVGSGELVARNKVASELGYVEPGARLRRPPPDEEAEAPAAASPPRVARTRAARTPSPAAAVDAVDGPGVEVDDLDGGDDPDDLEEIEPAEPGEDDDGDALEVDEADTDANGEPPAAAGAAEGAAADTLFDTAPEATPDAAGTEAPAPAPADAPKAKARAKPRAKSDAAKARKPAPAKAKAAKPTPPEDPPVPPVRGVLVSTRVTKPVPTRGLMVSSPRMRGVTGGVAVSTPDTRPAPSTTPGPAVAPSTQAPGAPAPTDPGPPGGKGSARSKPTAEAPGAVIASAAGGSDSGTSAPEPGPSRPDSPEPVSTPGGAGVRKAVAQVTSVRVAASRALVARAMLPKPAPPVVSRPTLGGRVNQPPAPENPPLPIRPRPKESSGPTAPRPESARPPLRLQPAPDPSPASGSPFRRSSLSDDISGSGDAGGGERPAEPSRSPFTPRPPAPRVERPPAGRPPVRPAPRPEGSRPQAARPQAARPEGARPPAARPEGARAEPGRLEDRRPVDRRPPDGRPNDRRADERRRPDPDDEPDDGPGRRSEERTGRQPPGAEGRPRISAPPAGDWRPSGGRQRPPSGPPVVAPPTGIDEPRPRRRLRRPRP